jgi:uncharacterized phage protein (TIGR01671 family)
MKRVIKFRGKRVDNGEWVFGNLINWHPNLNPRILWFEECEINKHKETNYEVHPNTVGQFTGLFDKNGKEIYEGDLYVITGDTYKIMYINGAIVGGISKDSCSPIGWESDMEYGDLIESDFYKQITILGNIHDNPELL